MRNVEADQSTPLLIVVSDASDSNQIVDEVTGSQPYLTVNRPEYISTRQLSWFDYFRQSEPTIYGVESG